MWRKRDNKNDGPHDCGPFLFNVVLGGFMKRAIVALLVILLMVGCTSKDTTSDSKLKIGVLQLADHPSLDATYEGMKKQLNELLGEDAYTIVFYNAQGQPSNVTTMANQLVSDKVDLIYAIATNAAQASLTATINTEIPVVFNAVTDPVEAGLVKTLDVPGGNVTGVSDVAPMAKQLALIKEVLPNAKKVGIIYNVGEVNSVVQIEQAKELATGLGLEIVTKGITQAGELQIAAQQIVADVDAVYTITDNMVVSGMPTLIDQANSAKKPVFAAEGGQMDKGLLASESISYEDLGKRAGTMIKEILVDKKDVASMPVVRTEETELLLNKDVAKMLGIEIPASVLDRVSAE